MSEIHSLIITDILESTEFFKDFTTEQIIGLLSCFADIKIAEDYKIHSFPINDYIMGSCIKYINESIEKYANLELRADIYS